MHVPTLPKKSKTLLTTLTSLTLFAGLAFPLPAAAAVSQAAPAPRITFTFDDAYTSAYTQAAPTLAAHGLKGVNFVPTGCVGSQGTCDADTQASYMTWEQVLALQNTYGWEIGAHTTNHLPMTTLSSAQKEQELTQSQQAFVAHGLNPTNFATPEGDYDNATLAAIAKYYASHRGFWDQGNNLWPYNDYLINNMQVQAGVSVNEVKSRIDQAIANNEWLVLTFHDIQPTPNTDPEEYEYATADLDQIAAYVKGKQDAGQMQSVLLKEGLVTSSTNLLGNSSFDSGIGGGWTTDAPASVTLDTSGKGSYAPGNTAAPANSVKLVSGASSVHLFSPMVSVAADQTYMLKSFLNLSTRTSGELGYYIDEYDASGNWVSGQWKQAETTPFVESFNFTYTPTSANVKQASLQVYVTPNSGITAYVDNFQWFPLQETTTPPPPSSTNVMPNSSFDSGVGTGWTTDNSTAFKADSTNQGAQANPTNSVKAVAGTTNAHLFSPEISVDSTLTYTIKAFLRILTLQSGEIGFYVDEYDVNGAWISGQYLSGKRNTGDEDVELSYLPSSSSVKKAKLQIILVGNSGITAYVDNVQWLVPAGNTPPPDEPPVAPPSTPTTILETNFASGLTGGWTTDSPANITADASGQGADDEAQNAIKFVAGTNNAHLFSPHVVVDPAKAYTIQSFVNITAMTSGEVAFYVDEYDAMGNWVSGKYITGIRSAGSQTVTLDYTPSSATVAQASLQVIVTGNSGITAYVDSIKWATGV